MRLPPDVNSRQFATFTQRLADVVGGDWVFTSEEDVHTYRDAYTPFRGDEANELLPSGAVAPANVEQVQAIVRLANEFKVPLWPVSTGRNLGYGGSAPRLSGTLVLDLKRMNRVLEVNQPLAYAFVEPGVSYYDFYKHLRDHDLKVWMDCPDPGWGSLIGNALDHGVGHTPYRDHNAAICSLEVVLPNGELMRTGANALSNTSGWQTFQYGYGPDIAPMFGQSNLGVITKAGFLLLPEPEAARNDVISAPDWEDVHPLLDTLSTLVSEFVLDSSWNLVSPLLSSRDPEVRAAVMRSGGEPSPEIARLGREKNLPYWSVRVRYYGAPEVIDAKWAYTQRRIKAAIPAAGFAPGRYWRFPEDRDRVEEEAGGDTFAKGAVGIPSMSIFTGGGAARSSGHIFFSPIIPSSGAELLRARAVFRQAYKDLGLNTVDQGIGGWSWFRRTLVLLFAQPISQDPEQNRRMRANVRHLVKVAADNGWGEYRTPPVFQDDVMAAYSFNDNALLRFHEAVKDALDPNGIMAPGRAGVWPKRLRNMKGSPRI